MTRKIIALLLIAFYVNANVVFAAGITIPVGSTVNMNTGNLTVPGDVNNAGTLQASTGSITLTGNWANTGTFTRGTGSVVFRGTGQSDITGTTTFNNLTIDTNADGAKTVRFGAGQTQTIANTLSLTGYSGKMLTILSTTSGTQGILDIPASIATGVDYVDVKDNRINGGLNHTITAGDNSIDSGNDINWWFGTGTPITITGSLYQSDRTTKLTTQTVKLSINGHSPIQVAASAGDFTFSNVRVNAGDVILCWISGDATYKGNTIAVVNTTDLSGLAVYADQVTVRYETGSSITNNNLYAAKGTLSDTDIKYSVAGAGNNNLTVDDGYKLYIPAAYTHAPGGTTTVHDIEIAGTLNAGGNNVTVSGDWDNTSGTYTPGANTTIFNPAVTQTLTPGGTTTAKTFNNITIAGPGELNLASSSELVLTGDWNLSAGAFDANSGTVTFDGASGSVSTLSGNTTFYNLKCVTAGKELDFTAGSTQTVSGTMTITGSSASKVKLRSTSSSNKWAITFTGGAQSVSYVDVKDSDANTNTVMCYNSTDSGNNNANWIFSTLAITSPTEGKTVGTTPTVRGTAGANKTVTIKDKNGNTVATTTADANGNFRVAVTTALTEGANSLTPYADLIAGPVVNITVVTPTTTAQVPTITSPLSGARINSSKPTVIGSAKASQTVTLTAKDSGGNLLLTDVATATVDASGSYTIQSTDYTTALPKGTIYLSVTVDGVTSAIINVSLTDPYGVVFDSVSNNPVGGAVVTIFKSDGTQCTPGVELDIADTNPQTTTSSGAYSYLAVNGNYYITVSAAGYGYPSVKTSFPSGRTITTGSKKEVFSVAGTVLTIDMPVDPGTLLLKAEMTANKKEAAVGDVVTYAVALTNSTSGDVTNVFVENNIPAGFKYISGRAILDGAPASEPAQDRPATFNIGTVKAGATKTLKYQLVIGSGVTFGKYENTAFARYSNGAAVSNQTSAVVKVIPSPIFDLGTAIGKVFWDLNENGIQDEGEAPVPNVDIMTEDGTIIRADKYGRFHLQALTPGRHLFRLVESTLPEGAYLVTDKVVITDITPGLALKVNYGVSIKDKENISGKAEGGRAVRMRQKREKPMPRLNVSLFGGEIIIRNGAPAQPAEFAIFSNYPLFINKWELQIKDADTRRLVKNFEGSRLMLNEPIYWDGKDKYGKFIQPGRDYVYDLVVTGNDGKTDTTAEKEFAVRTAVDKDRKMGLREFGGKRDDWIKRESKNNSIDKQTITFDGDVFEIESGAGPTGRVMVLKGGRLEADAPGFTTDMIVPRGEYDVKFTSPAGDEASSERIKSGEDYFFFVAMGDGKAGYTFNRGNIEPVRSEDSYKKGFWADGKLAYNLKGKIRGKYLISSSLDTDRDKKELFRNLDPDKYYPVYGDESSANYSAINTQGMLYLLVEWDKSSAVWGNYNTAFNDTEFARFNRSLYGGKVYYESVSTTRFGDPATKLAVFKAVAKQKAAHVEFLGTGGSLFYLKHKNVIEGSEKVKIEIRDKITGIVLGMLDQKENVDYQIKYDEGRIIFWRPIQRVVEDASIISRYLLDGNPLYVIVDYEYGIYDKYDEGSFGGRAQQALGNHVVAGGTYIKEELDKKNYELAAADTKLYITRDIKITGEYAQSKSEQTGSFISTDGGLSFTELPTDDSASGRAYGLKGEASLLDKRLGVSGYYKSIDRDFSVSDISSQQGKQFFGATGTYDISENLRLVLSRDTQRLLSGGNTQTQAQVGAEETTVTTAQLRGKTEKLDVTGEYRRNEVNGRKEQFISETNSASDDIALKAAYKLTDKTTASLEQQVTLSGRPNNQTTLGAVTSVNKWLSLKASEVVGTQGNATIAGAAVNASDRFKFAGDISRANILGGNPQDAVTVNATAKPDENSEVSVTRAVTTAAEGGSLASTAVVFGQSKNIDADTKVKLERAYAQTDKAGGRTLSESNTIGLTKEKNGKKLEGSVAQKFSHGAGESSNTNIFGLSGDINDKLAASLNFEKGLVQNLDTSQTERNAASLNLAYADKDAETGDIKLKASGKFDLRLDAGDTDMRQFVAYSAIDKKFGTDVTLFAKANLSETTNVTTNSITALYKELVAGGAYRPVYLDRLNMIGKYTFLEDYSPAGQTDYQDVERSRAHVFSTEGIYDINEKWQASEKVALKLGEEKVAGFGFTRTRTWLNVNRVNYNFAKDMQVAAEYRVLVQTEAKDYKQGALLEIAKKIGDFLQVGVGYNFTDFNDDLTHLDYTAHGPFVRMTGKLYDRTPREIALARERWLAARIDGWTWELINQELARPDSEIMKELVIYFYLGDKYYKIGELKKSEELYELVLEIGQMMHDEAREYVVNRIELESRLKEYDELAAGYYKSGNLAEAGRLWEKILVEAR